MHIQTSAYHRHDNSEGKIDEHLFLRQLFFFNPIIGPTIIKKQVNNFLR